MSKVEEKAEKAYPAWRNGIGDVFSQNSAYYGFIEGYHQAEKDLELTWEDMECIIKHYQDIMAEKSRVFVRVEDYQELLKRFKNLKK